MVDKIISELSKKQTLKHWLQSILVLNQMSSNPQERVENVSHLETLRKVAKSLGTSE